MESQRFPSPKEKPKSYSRIIFFQRLKVKFSSRDSRISCLDPWTIAIDQKENSSLLQMIKIKNWSYWGALDLQYKEINSPELKLRSNKGFITYKVNEKPLFNPPLPPPLSPPVSHSLFCVSLIMLSRLGWCQSIKAVIRLNPLPIHIHKPPLPTNFIHSWTFSPCMWADDLENLLRLGEK